jgi:outer membrane biosynthesis protein TonB
MARPTRLPILVALGLSLLLHMSAAKPLVGTLLAAASPFADMEARFDPEDFLRPEEEAPPPPPPDDPMLGIEDSPDTSSVTWIGHNEYEEHLARLAETEQAAFRQNPVIAPEPTPEQVTPPEPDVVPEEEPEPEPFSEAAPPPPDGLKVVEMDGLVGLSKFVDQIFVSATPSEATDTPEVAEGDTPEAAERKPSETKEPAPKDPKPKEKPEKPAPPKPKPPAPKPTPPTPPAEPDPADKSDRESDATSTIDIPLDQIKLGKPIARQGLELRPQRPRFTTLTLLTAAPANPLTEIDFDRRGVPTDARVVRSSGDRRIDHAVESSLFRWRARGKRLADLKSGEVITIQIRIVINR